MSDPELQPRLSPRPDDDAVFLHGILEGLTDIEARIYRLLADLGATPLKRVRAQMRLFLAGSGVEHGTGPITCPCPCSKTLSDVTPDGEGACV